jgi:signal transduction histidine kinase/ActR/RegA family two-component response regulator
MFVVLFLAAVGPAVRHPKPATLDAAAFFGGFAAVILVSRVAALLGFPAAAFAGVTIVLFEALPYLLLRLANDFVRVPPVAMRLAEAGLLVSIAGFFALQGTAPLILAILIIGYFAVVMAYAGWTFVRASTRASGVMKRRLRAIAAGAFLIGLTIALLGLNAVIPGDSGIEGASVQLVALTSAVCFGLGFVAPRPLRRMWQEPELRAFLQRSGSLSVVPDNDAVLLEIQGAASAALGARTAIGLWIPDRQVLRFHEADQAPTELPADDVVSGRAWREQRTIFVADADRANPAQAAAYRARDVGSFLAVPVSAGERRIGVMVVYQRRSQSFADDDSALAEQIAATAGVVLANRALANEAAAGRDAAERATQAKSEFLSGMSHELRTPLNAILGFSELLTEQVAEVLTDRQRRYLGNITDAGAHLLELINDVLDLSKVEAGKVELHPEPVALGVLMQPIVAAARAGADRDGLRLELSIADAALVRIDIARVRQIFYNLMSNALKFTRAGGLVRISAWVEDEDLVGEVADTGIGIAPDRRDRLFGVFERVHDERTTKIAGTGLGLALTKRLVELHHGSIDCQSEENVGTTFRVRLPHVLTESVSGDRVLIVEDELRDAELVAALATKAGHRWEIVRSAEAALNAIARSMPIGIVLDIRLPDRRGEEVLRALKSDPLTRAIPVIVVTVEDDDGRMRQLGADDHITKPIAAERLATWLARIGSKEPVGAPAGR